MSFRARPARRGRLYFEVHIFADVRALRAYGRSCDPPITGMVAGACRPWETMRVRKDGRTKRSPHIGEILLAADHLTVGIVPHECMHAALAWARRTRLNLDAMPHEERACYALSNLTRTIYRRCFAAGLLVESRSAA